MTPNDRLGRAIGNAFGTLFAIAAKLRAGESASPEDEQLAHALDGVADELMDAAVAFRQTYPKIGVDEQTLGPAIGPRRQRKR